MTRRIIFFLVWAFIFLFSIDSDAQKKVKRTKTFDQSRYKKQRVQDSRGKVECPIFKEGQYPYNGFGFKVGDPFALTYKFYPAPFLGLAIDAGKPASAVYNQYDRLNFGDFIQFDTLSEGSSIAYIDHVVKSDWVVEAKLLYHINASGWVKGLQVYAGAGWQWRKTRIQYDYIHFFGANEDETGNFVVDRFYMGPTFVTGFEYAYFNTPVSMFVEVELFRDIREDPGWTRMQGGVGLRYVF